MKIRNNSNYSSVYSENKNEIQNNLRIFEKSVDQDENDIYHMIKE